MKRYYVVASHESLAAGMARTLEFILGVKPPLAVLTAYVNNKPIDEQVKQLLARYDKNDEVVIFTDLLAGSVNQKFFPYISRPHTHIVTGMNLSVVLATIMEPTSDYITPARMQQLVNEARDQLVYVNTLKEQDESDDE